MNIMNITYKKGHLTKGLLKCLVTEKPKKNPKMMSNYVKLWKFMQIEHLEDKN